MKRLIYGALFVFLLLLPGRAGAQPADPEQLFAEGLALMGEESYAEALQKLEAAQALDPGIGTLFNIALCHEKLGRLATAFREYGNVQTMAHASAKLQREESARTKLEALRPRLSILVLQPAEPGAVTLKVDGVIVSPAEWTSYPVDPGAHRIDAEATAKKSWTSTVDAPAAGEQRVVEIAPLLPASEDKVVNVTHVTTNARRNVGIILGGVGVAGLVTATVTGIMLLNDKASADEQCRPECKTADNKRNEAAISDVNQGRSLMPINTVAWVVAGAGLAAGAYLILTSGKKVAPMAGGGVVGLVLSGAL